MRQLDGYLNRAEFIIVEARILLSLVYLPQPLTVLSSPRRYLGRDALLHDRTALCDPMKMHNSCIANKNGIQSQSVPFS